MALARREQEALARELKRETIAEFSKETAPATLYGKTVFKSNPYFFKIQEVHARNLTRPLDQNKHLLIGVVGEWEFLFKTVFPEFEFILIDETSKPVDTQKKTIFFAGYPTANRLGQAHGAAVELLRKLYPTKTIIVLNFQKTINPNTTARIDSELFKSTEGVSPSYSIYLKVVTFWYTPPKGQIFAEFVGQENAKSFKTLRELIDND